MSEYFKIVRKEAARPVFYAAVVARSYAGINQREQVRIDGWTYSPEYLRTGDKVLIVDDIYDSGRTINHLAEVILAKGLPRQDVKIAVHDYKICEYRSERLPIAPDYWCRKHVIEESGRGSMDTLHEPRARRPLRSRARSALLCRGPRPSRGLRSDKEVSR
jgi:hypoxanthine phosphoribosyltransferase